MHTNPPVHCYLFIIISEHIVCTVRQNKQSSYPPSTWFPYQPSHLPNIHIHPSSAINLVVATKSTLTRFCPSLHLKSRLFTFPPFSYLPDCLAVHSTFLQFPGCRTKSTKFKFRFLRQMTVVLWSMTLLSRQYHYRSSCQYYKHFHHAGLFRW